MIGAFVAFFDLKADSCSSEDRRTEEEEEDDETTTEERTPNGGLAAGRANSRPAQAIKLIIGSRVFIIIDKAKKTILLLLLLLAVATVARRKSCKHTVIYCCHQRRHATLVLPLRLHLQFYLQRADSGSSSSSARMATMI